MGATCSLKSAGDVANGNVRKHQPRTDCDPRSGIIATHHRIHVVATGVQAVDNAAIRPKHARILVGHQSCRGADISGMESNGIERGPRNGAKAWVWLMRYITRGDPLVVGAAATEIQVSA